MGSSPVNRGVTAVELLLAIGVIGVVAGALSLLATRGFSIPREQAEQERITEDARKELTRIANAVRNARNVDVDNDGVPTQAWLVKAEPYELQMFTNVDGDDATEIVRYFVEGSELKRGVGDVIPGQCPADPEEVITQLNSIRNIELSEPVFSYIYSGSPAQIESLSFSLTIDVDQAQHPEAATVTVDTVAPRIPPITSAETCACYTIPCTPAPTPTPWPLVCEDGLDNDGDSLLDCADPDCHTDGDANNPNSCSTVLPPPLCEDPNPANCPPPDPLDQCENPDPNQCPPPPPPPPSCQDNADNDGDGLVDCADPDCHTDGDANNPNSCPITLPNPTPTPVVSPGTTPTTTSGPAPTPTPTAALCNAACMPGAACGGGLTCPTGQTCQRYYNAVACMPNGCPVPDTPTVGISDSFSLLSDPDNNGGGIGEELHCPAGYIVNGMGYKGSIRQHPSGQGSCDPYSGLCNLLESDATGAVTISCIRLNSDGTLGDSTGWLSNPRLDNNPRYFGEFYCPAGAVYTGISQKGIVPFGDENDGLTTYCQPISLLGLGAILPILYSEDLETNSRPYAYTTCGANKVVTGIFTTLMPQGDSNGNFDVDSIELFCSNVEFGGDAAPLCSSTPTPTPAGSPSATPTPSPNCLNTVGACFNDSQCQAGYTCQNGGCRPQACASAG